MSYFEDQQEAWFEGGREWYAKDNDLSPNDERLDGIPGDFDPYVFWAETEG